MSQAGASQTQESQSEHQTEFDNRETSSTQRLDGMSNAIGEEVVRRCDEVLERFRSQGLSRERALELIEAIIPDVPGNERAREVGIRSYARILDEFGREEGGARGGGRDPIAETDERREDGGLDADRTGRRGDKDVERGQAEFLRRVTRSRSESPGDEDHPAKKKINISGLPWLQDDAVNRRELRESVKKTQEILENVGRDVGYAVKSIKTTIGAPQFPTAEWRNVLTGEAVNLDRVLSGLHGTARDEGYREKIGELEIQLGTTAPAKVVRSFGDWVCAWNPTMRASTFVFPHRTDEYERYGAYIMQQFAAWPASLHGRIILFDKAIRTRVAHQLDVLLTDFEQFQDLRMHWLDIGEDEYGVRQPRQRRDPGGPVRRRDACRRWNEGRCPNTQAACNYVHHCSKCRDNTHVASECTK
jgi:hypothetical protein